MTNDNIHLLKQSLDLLRRIDDRLYREIPRGAAKSGIGGHIRHCLDFYCCFLRGLETGRIDYDARVRNELIEKDRKMAIANIEAAINRLQDLPVADDLIAIQVKAEGGCGSFGWSYSSIRRELQFLLSHTVHHFALIAMMLRLQGFEPAEDFGVAPSTLGYWQQKAA